MGHHDDITQTEMFRQAAAQARKESRRYWAKVGKRISKYPQLPSPGWPETGAVEGDQAARERRQRRKGRKWPSRLKCDIPAARNSSERGLALAFAEHAALTTRYVSDWGRWMLYDGTVWVRDETLKVVSDVMALCEDASLNQKPNEALRLCSARTSQRGAVDGQGRPTAGGGGRPVGQRPDGPQLRGGRLARSRGRRARSDSRRLFHQLTAVRPGGDCPLWMEFLAMVTASDAALMDYLQRVAAIA